MYYFKSCFSLKVHIMKANAISSPHPFYSTSVPSTPHQCGYLNWPGQLFPMSSEEGPEHHTRQQFPVFGVSPQNGKSTAVLANVFA